MKAEAATHQDWMRFVQDIVEIVHPAFQKLKCKATTSETGSGSDNEIEDDEASVDIKTIILERNRMAKDREFLNDQTNALYNHHHFGDVLMMKLCRMFGEVSIKKAIDATMLQLEKERIQEKRSVNPDTERAYKEGKLL